MSLRFNQNECRRAVMKILVLNELPLSFTENLGFRYFYNVSCPLFNVPSYRTAIKDITQLYANEKCKLKSIISENEQRVSFTIDIWTSIRNSSYMVVTAHFLDSDWNLHRKILSFSTISSHRAEVIGKHLEDCLLDWGIERVFTITVDNVSTNEGAINYLKRRLRDWKEDSIVLNGDFMHVHCAAYILNLIVSNGLKELNERIVCIRNAVKYVRFHTLKGQAFKKFMKSEKIEYKKNVVPDLPKR